MKARKLSDSKSLEKRPVLIASLAKDNVCGFFKLLLDIDKRNHPKLYEDQKSRNSSHSAI